MTIKPGDKLPDFRFKYFGKEGVAEISTDELFGGKTAVLFAVPGAFTPTCHANHLPGFLNQLENIRAKGVEAESMSAFSVVSPAATAASE